MALDLRVYIIQNFGAETNTKGRNEFRKGLELDMILR